MQIGLGVLWKVKINHLARKINQSINTYHVDGLNVNAARKQIRTDEIAALAAAKVVKDAIAMCLRHSGVNVKARVAQLCNLACE